MSKTELSEVRIRVLQKLAATDGFIRHDDFHSAPSSHAPRRGTRLGRKMRGLPYTATFAPLVAGGLIIEKYDQFKRRIFQITPAGRAALSASSGRGE